jgi:hypothetical protein
VKKAYKDKRVMVVDHGLFVSWALRLASEFGEVYYHNPSWKAMSPRTHELRIGHGFEQITMVRDFWDMAPNIDLFVFPYIYDGDLQKELVRQGRRVWGARNGDQLENFRAETKEEMKKLGMPVNDYAVVDGISKLREFLQKHPNVYVKIPLTRGDTESFHSPSYDEIIPKLREIEHELDEAAEEMQFVVEKPIYPALEIGYDGFTIDGQFPAFAVNGVEVKDCYDSETEILTEDGWKFFRDLNKSERVLTLNIEDSLHYRIEYQNPTAFIADDYSGQMLEIKSEGVDLLVTPNHKLLVQSNCQDPTRKEVEWTGYDGITRRFRQAKHKRMLVPASDLNLKKGFCMPCPRSAQYYPRSGKGITFSFSNGICMTKRKFARFLAIFLAEGWTDGKRRVVISQEKYRDDMESVIRDCGFHRYSTTKSGFEISNQALAEYLKKFGKSKQKFVPSWIKMCSKQIINEFLTWYCLGDGSFMTATRWQRGEGMTTPGTARQITTYSKRMADDLQELFAKIGRYALIHSRETPTGTAYVIRERPSLCKNHIFSKHAKWIDYNGRIYCVTVPNHIVLVRRNGKPIWSGNSAYLGAFLPYSSLDEHVRQVNTWLSPALKDYGYRGLFSTEVRVGPDEKPYLIDLTCRGGSPPSESMQEIITNWGDIMWFGAEGILAEPESASKYCAQAVIYSEFADEGWQPVTFPEEVRDRVKLFFHCQIKGKDYVIPQHAKFSEIGWVVGAGDTVKAAIQDCKDVAAQVGGYKIEVRTEGLEKAVEEIEKGERMGVQFSDEPIS